MKNVVLDFRASQECVDALLDLKFNVIKTPKLKNVYEQICGHADIMLHCLEDGIAVAEKSVYTYFKDRLENCILIEGSSRVGSEYPKDIAYNAARVGKCVFCNEKNTDAGILKYYREHDYHIVDVKQGYAKCSVCKVTKRAIITSDKGICHEAEKYGIDVLLIMERKILLPRFEYGFIGGATGLLDEKTLAICGDIEYLDNCDKILGFCEKYGVDVLSLCKGQPLDVGTILVI